MTHNTLLLTFPSITAFAAGSKQGGTGSQRLVQVQKDATQSAQNMNDYSPVQEAEVVDELPNQFPQLNPNLYRLALAIRLIERGHRHHNSTL
jgi:hypothetical protein